MIHEQYMADISLESCADALGMNSYTLSKAFKQVTGINFIDYVTQIRIEKAKELLVNTNKKFMMCQKQSATVTITSIGFLKTGRHAAGCLQANVSGNALKGENM